MIKKVLVRNKILHEARLPFSTIKGSVAHRQKLAGKYTKEFYNNLNPYCLDGMCEVNHFRASLDKVIAPSKISYAVAPEQNNMFNGSMGTLSKLGLDENNDFMLVHLGYKFLLPMDESNNYILNKFTAFHEVRHFFDRLFNPKINMLRASNGINYLNSDRKIDTINDLFLSDLSKPVNMKEFKRKIDSLLTEIPNPVKIDLFQSIRYRLQSEINAYRDELKYFSKEKWSLNNLKSMLNFSLFLMQNCKFNSKLKYANKILKESINNERSKFLGVNSGGKSLGVFGRSLANQV